MRAMLLTLTLAVLVCTTVGCGQGPKTPQGDRDAMPGGGAPAAGGKEAAPAGEQAPIAVMSLTSLAFTQGGAIPSRYSCDGENVSPPLSWSRPPDGTMSLALIMDDPDAVAVAKKVWDHWIMYNISAETTALPEALPADPQFGNGAQQGQGSAGIGYRGPCPPSGAPHRYYFRLYALGTRLALAPGATKDQLLAAMEGHVIAKGELMGIYSR